MIFCLVKLPPHDLWMLPFMYSLFFLFLVSVFQMWNLWLLEFFSVLSSFLFSPCLSCVFVLFSSHFLLFFFCSFPFPFFLFYCFHISLLFSLHVCYFLFPLYFFSLFCLFRVALFSFLPFHMFGFRIFLSFPVFFFFSFLLFALVLNWIISGLESSWFRIILISARNYLSCQDRRVHCKRKFRWDKKHAVQWPSILGRIYLIPSLTVVEFWVVGRDLQRKEEEKRVGKHYLQSHARWGTFVGTAIANILQKSGVLSSQAKSLGLPREFTYGNRIVIHRYVLVAKGKPVRYPSRRKFLYSWGNFMSGDATFMGMRTGQAEIYMARVHMVNSKRVRIITCRKKSKDIHSDIT